MFCPECGAESRDEDDFCASCGARLPQKGKNAEVESASSSVADSSQPGSSKSVASAPEAELGSGGASGAGGSAGAGASGGSSGGGNRRLVVAIVVLAVALVAVLGYLFGSGIIGAKGDPWDNGVKINPNVVVYEEGSSPFEILASDAGSVTVSSMDGLSEDSIISAGVTSTTPDGLLRKIDSVQRQDDGTYRLKTRQAALTEAIEECDITVKVALKDDGTPEVSQATGGSEEFVPIRQAHAFNRASTKRLVFDSSASDPDNAVFSLVEKDYIVDQEITKTMGIQGDLELGYEIDAHLKIKDGKADVRFVLDWYTALMLGINSASVSTEFDLAEIESVEKIFKAFADQKLTFMAGPVPVVIVFGASPSIEFDAEWSGGYGKVDATLDKSVGFEYTTEGGLKGVNEDRSIAPGFNIGISGNESKCAGSIGLKLNVEALLYGLTGLGASVGTTGEVSASLVPVNDADAPKLPGSETPFAGKLGAKVYVPLTGSFKVEPLAGIDNPFDTEGGSLGEFELFDTEDAIVLWECNKVYKLPAASAPGSKRPSTDDPGSAAVDGLSGKVVVTTYAKRAKEVAPDLVDDFSSQKNDVLVLFVLDSPRQVSAASSGDFGKSKTDLCRTIKLPSGEGFEELEGEYLTLSSKEWGFWPSDVAGALYDIDASNVQGIEIAKGAPRS